ncbi:MAG: hypothetical protein AAF563_11605 [Pseudomonadota bacterium]
MKVDASPQAMAAVLGAMKTVASAGDSGAPSDDDRAAIAAAGHFFFDLKKPLDVAGAVTPGELAGALTGDDLRGRTIGFLAVMAFVDGVVDKKKIALVEDYADALGFDAPYLKEMNEAVLGHLRWAGMDMVRHNMLSITHRMWADGDVMPWLLPYQDANNDPALAKRFHDLEHLPEGSLGHSFWDHYTHHKFAFPGEQNALNAIFAVPHDTTHLLSGYATTYAGEILVSTFTAGMHPDQPVAGHILPVLFSWHLGIELIEHAGAHKGALDPVHFWEAWSRGQQLTTDVFAPDWDFWAHAEEPLVDLKAAYGVPAKEAQV